MKINLLLFSPHADQMGGVVEYLKSLSKNFSDNVNCCMIFVGQRNIGAGLFCRMRALVTDCYHLVRTLSVNNYNIVHINPSLKYYSLLRDGIFLTILRLAGMRNVVIFIHGWDEAVEKTISNNKLYQIIFKQVFGWPPVIYVLANRFKASLGEYKFELNNIYTTTTMFDGSAFTGISRQRLDERIRILFISRMTKEKGVYELLDSMDMVFKRNNRVELIMAGDGDEFDQIKMRAEKRKLAGKVALPGYVSGEEKYQMLADADIFILPTYYGEGCPVAILEAMAAGLPIISTSVGGIGDILEDGVNGILLEDVASKNIEVALMKLIDDKSMRLRVGAKNKEIAWKKYEASVVVAKIENDYKKIALR